MGWKLKAVQSVISCWEAETWTLQWWVILIQSGSARHCRPPHLSDSSLSPSPYLPPSWALVPGWQLLMGRRRVVFIIMPLFIHVSVASDSRVYASLYFLPASSEMSHIHHPLSLSFSHSLSVLSSSQVLLLLSFKKKKKKRLWKIQKTHQSNLMVCVSTVRTEWKTSVFCSEIVQLVLLIGSLAHTDGRVPDCSRPLSCGSHWPATFAL